MGSYKLFIGPFWATAHARFLHHKDAFVVVVTSTTAPHTKAILLNVQFLIPTHPHPASFSKKGLKMKNGHFFVTLSNRGKIYPNMMYIRNWNRTECFHYP